MRWRCRGAGLAVGQRMGLVVVAVAVVVICSVGYGGMRGCWLYFVLVVLGVTVVPAVMGWL